MNKWSYLVFNYIGGEQAPRVIINGEIAVKGDKTPQLHEALNQLGDQGWELVAVDGREYIFKRPDSSLWRS